MCRRGLAVESIEVELAAGEEKILDMCTRGYRSRIYRSRGPGKLWLGRLLSGYVGRGEAIEVESIEVEAPRTYSWGGCCRGMSDGVKL